MGTMASADFSYSNSWLILPTLQAGLMLKMSTGQFLIARPSVRQYRILQSGFLQCIGRPKPPCHLLILPSVTPAHKGLAPSGKNKTLVDWLLSNKFAYLKFFKSLQQVCAHAHAGHTHDIAKRGF